MCYGPEATLKHARLSRQILMVCPIYLQRCSHNVSTQYIFVTMMRSQKSSPRQALRKTMVHIYISTLLCFIRYSIHMCRYPSGKCYVKHDSIDIIYCRAVRPSGSINQAGAGQVKAFMRMIGPRVCECRGRHSDTNLLGYKYATGEIGILNFHPCQDM